ncbi:MAG: DUF4197 domain-containing protein [Alcanivorax sp.]
MRLLLLCSLFLAGLIGAPANIHAAEDKPAEGHAEQKDKVKLGADLTDDEIVNGLKEVLKKGTESAVAVLARKDGYYKNPDVRIELPPAMSRVVKEMQSLDNMSLIETLEMRMNRMAEKVTPTVAGYFIVGVNQVKFDNPQRILNGEGAAATKYLKDKMSYGLVKAIRPKVKEAMQHSGVYRAYEDVIDEYRRIPFVPNVRGVYLEDYLVDRIMTAIFLYIERSEVQVRINPKKRPSELVNKLFTVKSEGQQ